MGLEQVLGGPGILRSWNAVSNKSGVAGKIRNARSVLDLALEGNPAAQKIVLQRARLLKDVVLNLSLTLNPSLFVFGGDLGAHEALLEPTVEMLRTFVAENMLEVSNLAARVAGGQGYLKGNPVERYFRDLRSAPLHTLKRDEVLEMIAAMELGFA